MGSALRLICSDVRDASDVAVMLVFGQQQPLLGRVEWRARSTCTRTDADGIEFRQFGAQKTNKVTKWRIARRKVHLSITYLVIGHYERGDVGIAVKREGGSRVASGRL